MALFNLIWISMQGATEGPVRCTDEDLALVAEAVCFLQERSATAQVEWQVSQTPVLPCDRPS